MSGRIPPRSQGPWIPHGWGPRCAASAVLCSRYCQVTADDNAAALDSHLIGDAPDAGYDDFDAAPLKNGAARAIGTTPVDCQSVRAGPGVGSEVLTGAA